MANIETPTWRCKEKIGNIMSRVQKNAAGELERPMTASELKAAEIYLRKTVPDLNKIEQQMLDGSGKPTSPSFNVTINGVPSGHKD